MVMQRLEIELRKTRNPKDLKHADLIASWLKERGSDFPLTGETSTIYPEISLEAEMERQAKRYLDLKFHKHKKIGMSSGEFKDLIMELVASQPEDFKGRLNTPVAVFGQISPKDQCRLAGIDYFPDNTSDWTEDPQRYKTPNYLYLTWTDKGARFMNRTVRDVRKELLLDERGGTEFDGIGLYIIKPEVLEARSLDLPGTAVESGYAAYLDLRVGRPKLNYNWIDNANPKFGSLVCDSLSGILNTLSSLSPS